jgi:hypothetical protein
VSPAASWCRWYVEARHYCVSFQYQGASCLILSSGAMMLNALPSRSDTLLLKDVVNGVNVRRNQPQCSNLGCGFNLSLTLPTGCATSCKQASSIKKKESSH